MPTLTVVYSLSHGATAMFLLLGSHTFASIAALLASPSSGGDLSGISTPLNNFVSGVTTILSGLGVGVAVIGIIVGGLMRATAFGNERKVAVSNQAIACAIVGLAIVLIAQTAATAISTFFGGK